MEAQMNKASKHHNPPPLRSEPRSAKQAGRTAAKILDEPTSLPSAPSSPDPGASLNSAALQIEQQSQEPTPSLPPLHPEHLADLRRSGLTEETIRTLGIRSERPHDIPKLVGWNPPDVTSALVFPYPGEDGFCRVKVFPPYTDKDGHTVKYLQPPNSGCRLYVPPRAASVLGDPSKPLGWTEGEKKAAKACQEGIPCIGLGGLWNWLEDGKPIAKLDEIAHVDREEIIYADSDVWTRPKLQQAIYALGKELESRGAKPLVAVITPGPDGEKRGLDDFLVQGGVKGLATLKRIFLKHKAFSHTDQWHKEWRKRKEQEGKPPPEAIKLLDRMESVRLIHPAQDFIDGIFLFGVPAGDEVVLITSERKTISSSDLPKGTRLDTRGFDLCRFSREGITQFLSGATGAGHDLLRRLERFFARFIVFRDVRLALLLATWTLGTYAHRVFRVFPYLALRSPTKRCGKSRVLDLLSLVAFNASQRTLNPTEAQLFRGPSKNAGTLLLDEVELLRGDKETFQGLLQVLNSRFERGGVVTRLHRTRDGQFEEVKFPTYAPLALAGINQLADTLEDRGLVIFMARKLRSEPVARFTPGRLEGEAQELRDACYIWALTHAADLAEVYEADAFPALDTLDDRARDLWESLLSVALLADAEATEAGEQADFAKILVALARNLSAVRDEGDTMTAKLVEALEAIVEEEQREVFTPTELVKFINAREGSDWPGSTKALAGLLTPLGLVARHDKIPVEGRRKTVRHYHLDRDLLVDLRRRYGSPEETPEEAQ